MQKILTSTNETIFIKNLDAWYEIHKDFLAEKIFNGTTGKENFTHAKLVSAYRGLSKSLKLKMVDDYFVKCQVSHIIPFQLKAVA